MKTRPERNRYLLGLGLGLLLGSTMTQNYQGFPTMVVIFGATVMVAGMVLSFWEGKNNDKK